MVWCSDPQPLLWCSQLLTEHSSCATPKIKFIKKIKYFGRPSPLDATSRVRILLHSNFVNFYSILLVGAVNGWETLVLWLAKLPVDLRDPDAFYYFCFHLKGFIISLTQKASLIHVTSFSNIQYCSNSLLRHSRHLNKHFNSLSSH